LQDLVYLLRAIINFIKWVLFFVIMVTDFHAYNKIDKATKYKYLEYSVYIAITLAVILGFLGFAYLNDKNVYTGLFSAAGGFVVYGIIGYILVWHYERPIKALETATKKLERARDKIETEFEKLIGNNSTESIDDRYIEKIDNNYHKNPSSSIRVSDAPISKVMERGDPIQPLGREMYKLNPLTNTERYKRQNTERYKRQNTERYPQQQQ
jgi:hypothetical protein